MCTHVTVFPSIKQEENERLASILKSLPPNIKLDYVKEARLIENLVDLPFVHTDDGERFFGIDEINLFVQRLGTK